MPNDHFSNGKKIAFTVVMFLYINLALTIFWILKPLKKSLFIGLYDGDQTFKLGSMEMLGSSAELLAKGMNLCFPHPCHPLGQAPTIDLLLHGPDHRHDVLLFAANQ